MRALAPSSGTTTTWPAAVSAITASAASAPSRPSSAVKTSCTLSTEDRAPVRFTVPFGASLPPHAARRIAADRMLCLINSSHFLGRPGTHTPYYSSDSIAGAFVIDAVTARSHAGLEPLDQLALLFLVDGQRRELRRRLHPGIRDAPELEVRTVVEHVRRVVVGEAPRLPHATDVDRERDRSHLVQHARSFGYEEDRVRSDERVHV